MQREILIAVLFCLFISSGPEPTTLHADERVKLGSSVQPFVDRTELAGAVMLVADGKGIQAQDAVGWADISAQKPMRVNSMFWIASQSKPMTAVALMMLIDQGLLGLDDPIEKFIPEFRGQFYFAEKDGEHAVLKKPRHPITVRNILSHTSGLAFKSGIEEPTLDLFPLAARVRSYAMSPLDFDPESKYQYSNEGINVAGRIVEIVTGLSFEAYCDERLFRPLGMTETTFWPTHDQVARLATSYKPGMENKGLIPTSIPQLSYPLTDRTIRFPMPAGGLFSTAHDIAQFYRMLLLRGELDGKRFLSEKSVDELIRRQTPIEWKDSYGLGFSVSPTSFGHGGAYSTNSLADTERKQVFIWLVQHAGFPGDGAKCQDAFIKFAKTSFPAR